MDFKVLNDIKSIFSEISNFYTNWNNEPTSILYTLENQPNTKRLKEDRERLINTQLRSDVTGKLTLPEQYKLSYKDVTWYLHFKLILPLQNTYLTSLVDELVSINSNVEKESREDWCKNFNHILSNLLHQVEIFNNTKLYKFDISDDTVDWLSIVKIIKSLSNEFLLPLIKQYKEIAEKYSINIIINNENRVNKIIIYIKQNAKKELIEDLIEYIPDPVHKSSLKALIDDNITPDISIVCHCKQVVISTIFYKRVKSKNPDNMDIETNKTVLTRWICKNFQVFRNGKVEKLTESTVRKALSGNNLGGRQKYFYIPIISQPLFGISFY